MKNNVYPECFSIFSVKTGMTDYEIDDQNNKSQPKINKAYSDTNSATD